MRLCISTVLRGSSENLRALDSCNRCMGFRSIILYFQLCVSPIYDLCISGCIADGIVVSLMPSSWSGMDVSLLSTHPFTPCGDDRRAAGSGYTPSLKSKKNSLHMPLRSPSCCSETTTKPRLSCGLSSPSLFGGAWLTLEFGSEDDLLLIVNPK